MDKWKDIELEKMKAGGNRQAKQFLKSQPDYNTASSFIEKYNTRAAALYRDKIVVEAQGQPWSEQTSAARDYQPHLPRIQSTPVFGSGHLPASKSSGVLQKSSRGGGYLASGEVDWDSDWTNTANSTVGSSTDEAFPSRDEIRKHQLEFSDRKKLENAERSDGLPPSQGGKYVGFGNTPAPTSDDHGSYAYLGGLNKSLSSFTIGASKIVKSAANQTTKIASATARKTVDLSYTASEKVKDSHIIDNVSSSVSNVAKKVKTGEIMTDMSGLANKIGTYSWRGWKDFSSVVFSNNPQVEGVAAGQNQNDETAAADHPEEGFEVREDSRGDSGRRPPSGDTNDWGGGDWGGSTSADTSVFNSNKQQQRSHSFDDDEGEGDLTTPRNSMVAPVIDDDSSYPAAAAVDSQEQYLMLKKKHEALKKASAEKKQREEREARDRKKKLNSATPGAASAGKTEDIDFEAWLNSDLTPDQLLSSSATKSSKDTTTTSSPPRSVPVQASSSSTSMIPTANLIDFDGDSSSVALSGKKKSNNGVSGGSIPTNVAHANASGAVADGWDNDGWGTPGTDDDKWETLDFNSSSTSAKTS